MLVTFLRQRFSWLWDRVRPTANWTSFECYIDTDHNGTNPSLVYHSYRPRYLRTPSTTVAACSHSMLLIREGQQPPLAHWTLFPGHANLHPVHMLVSQCIADCMFLCQQTVHHIPLLKVHIPLLKVHIPVAKGTYPIAKGTYPIAKGTYPIAKVMQVVFREQSIVAYLQDTLHNSDILHIANRTLKTRLDLSWHHLWDAILSRVWCLMTNRPQLEQIRAD